MTDVEIAGGVVCLMCGVAGSGKTTFARHLEARGVVRLSIDEEIWRRGRYGVDYPPEHYDALQVAAQATLDERLVALMRTGTAVVLDYSFWLRRERDRYTALIAAHDRPWRLLVLRPDPAVLRQRLAARRSRFDANAAFPITDDLLDRYLRGFQPPDGEGETVVS